MWCYTNYCRIGNDIFIRGFEKNGKRVSERIRNFIPDFFVPVINHGDVQVSKSIDGIPLKKISRKFNTLRELEDFLKSDFHVYGYRNIPFRAVAELFDVDEIEERWDRDKVSVAFIDIETECENGFPDPKFAQEKINIVSIHESLSNTFFIWFINDEISPEQVEKFRRDGENFRIERCEDESQLLLRLSEWFQEFQPDIVSGWNSQFFDIPYIFNRVFRLIDQEEDLSESEKERAWRKFISKFSPFKHVYRKFDRMTGEDRFEICGISHIDYMEAYKRFNNKVQPSYKLDFIVKVELGEEKFKHESGLPGHLLYKDHFLDAIQYNIHDVRLLVELERQKDLISLIMAITYSSLSNFSDAFGQIKSIENLMFLEMKKQGKEFSPPHENHSQDFEGAFVKPTVPGLYDWIVTFDVTSEYPSLIRALNISPETLVTVKKRKEDIKRKKFHKHEFPMLKEEIQRLKRMDDSQTFKLFDGTGETIDLLLDGDIKNEFYSEYCIAANGAMFRKDEDAVLPKVVTKLFNQRKHFKSKMLEVNKMIEECDDEEERERLKKLSSRFNLLQLGKKIQNNSVYGAMGNKHFNFFSTDLAEAVTLSGQFLIRSAIKGINDFINSKLNSNEDWCVGGDTDSIFINFGGFLSKKIGREKLKQLDPHKVTDRLIPFLEGTIQRVIDKSFDEFSITSNVLRRDALHMKREAICDRGLYVAKKNYILHVIDNEGVRFRDGKWKIMGLAAIKSSTPPLFAKWMKETFHTILFETEDKFHEKILEFKKKMNSSDVEDIAMTSSISDYDKWIENEKFGEVKKGTPVHVKAAVNHNVIIEEFNLSQKYEKIKSGDKIKWVYMKPCRVSRFEVFGFIIGQFPRELDIIHRNINVELQFEKGFLKPMELIAEKIGWSVLPREKEYEIVF